MISALECEANVLLSINKGVFTGGHCELGRCLAQDLVSVRQHNLLIKALNKEDLYVINEIRQLS